MKKKIFLPIWLLIGLSVFAQIEKQLPEAPVPMRYVVDLTGTLTTDQQQTLEYKLKSYEDTTSTQIEVVIIASTHDYDPAEYATALGRKWGVGQKGKNNGLIFLIAKDDRKVFIAPGYGLEGAIPDITAKQIIDDIVVPNFKGNDFYGGINQGIDALILAAKGEFKVDKKANRKKRDLDFPVPVIIVIIIIILAISRGGGGRGRRGGHWMYGGGGTSWGGGGWSGGSSWGGGGSSFGGGSFGGGGAGGSW